ncbi:epimerase [Luteipulveratus mongoliensis]|uniref:NAD-dependent dehydratase n=1 Tax=Luteipulveratus mongoliensis TaxID=571913 RepID=A0A0K1JLE9_9MICO|nr:NAD-dependent epimerase/dehydratase family protein [Luteipulveratus mongoliensis]AKU17400.1 NAD-dependent dehydratase [Luteipulveratus mongoliensis]
MSTSRPLKVVIAGGSGTLGRALSADLTSRGHEVVVLTRSPRSDAPYREVGWDGRTVGAWVAELEDADRPVALVNLAGRLVDVRPTPANIADLRASRVESTQALVTASQQVPPLEHWVQASTTAIYSDAGEDRITESSPIPDGLPQMTGVARPWEQAVVDANSAHLVILRTSLVLERGSPVLDRLLLLTRLGAGGKVGTGRQWVSWIHIADWLAVVRAALGLESDVTLPSGPVIVSSEHPVRNTELMATLRRATHRRIGLPSPPPLVRLGAVALRTDPALGLTGRHCTSDVLRDLDWSYAYPTLDKALADLLG